MPRSHANAESKVGYVNDVLGDLLAMLRKFEVENAQLKQLTLLLVHFKQMLHYALQSSAQFDEAFQADYEYCLTKWEAQVEGLQFVEDIEKLYQRDNESTKYCMAFKDIQLAGAPLAKTHHSEVSDLFQISKQSRKVVNQVQAQKASSSEQSTPVLDNSFSDCHPMEEYLELEYSDHGGDYNSSGEDTESDSDFEVVPAAKATRKSHTATLPEKEKLTKSAKTPKSKAKKKCASKSYSARRSTRVSQKPLEDSKKIEVQKQSERNADSEPQQNNSNVSQSFTNVFFRNLLSHYSGGSSACLLSNRKTTSERLNFLACSPLYKLKSKKISATSEDDLSNKDLATPTTTASDSIVLDHAQVVKAVNVSLFCETRQVGTVKQYACAVAANCQYVHTERALVVGHILKHFNLKPFGCSHCDYRTDMRPCLQRHALRQHQVPADLFPYMDYFGSLLDVANESSSFVCRFSASCQFEATQAGALLEHINWHLCQTPFKCAFCEARFADLALIRQHLLSDHRRQYRASGWKPSRRRCPFANCTFTLEEADREKMLTHIQDHHQFIEQLSSTRTGAQAFTSTPNKRLFPGENIELGSAKRRRASFLDDGRLTASTGHTLQDYENAIQELFDNIARNKVPTSQGNYCCSYKNCRFRSPSWPKVKSHEYRHHMKRVFQCSHGFCYGAVFPSKEQLNEHLIAQHDISQHRCGVEGCNRPFVSSSQLKQHMNELHSNAYLTCSKCQKLFKCRLTMMKHYRVNHVEGEYRCLQEGCHFVGQYRAELEQHNSALHSKMKKCPVAECGQMVQSSVFQAHMKRHYNVKSNLCSWPECGKSFVGRKSLKDHMRIHVGFKRFRCKWEGCGYASEQRSNTIKHINIRHLKLPYTKRQQLEKQIFSDLRPQDYLEVLPDVVNI